MIPEFQKLMLPLLTYINDGKIYNIHDCMNALALELNLTDEDLNEWLPSKSQKKFYNYFYWAKAHLKMAGAVENKGRGKFQITDRGLSILKENPSVVNIKYLTAKYEDYKDLLKGKNYNKLENNSTIETEIAIAKQTPEEQIELEYQKIKISLQEEIISKLKLVHPSFFEKIVIDLLVKMGYGGSFAEAAKATRYSNDEGIDGIIKEDKLGLDVIYVQAKRWESVVGRPELHKFVGALAGQGAKKGIFITTSSFSKDAEQYIPKNDTKIVLIDGEQLANYMIDYNLGVSVKNVYEIKRIDIDYFEED